MAEMTLTVHAEHLADLFSLLPGVCEVGLAGSLARVEDQKKANDIDLVILHDGSMADCCFSAVRDTVRDTDYGNICGWEITAGKKMLTDLLNDRAHAILRYIREHVDCKVDIICANRSVLTDCNALRRFSTETCPDPEFSSRIFCELPLLKFDRQRGKFGWGQLKHGSCCKPRVSWEVVRKLREQGLVDILRLITPQQIP